MKAYLEAIRSFRKEIIYLKSKTAQSYEEQKKVKHLITLLEGEILRLTEIVKPFVDSQEPLIQELIDGYYFNAVKFSKVISRDYTVAVSEQEENTSQRYITRLCRYWDRDN